MTTKRVLNPAGLAAAVLLALGSPAWAQSGTLRGPDYSSGASAGKLSDSNFNTPTADGRPGVYFFTQGVKAVKSGDYKHALDMYKVAASWAYKPAEYNLAIMYFKGQGVPVDRARGAAWMILAAERGGTKYMQAQDLMVSALTKTEFAHADKIWNELKPTYSDAVALKRAKVQWARAKSDKTGSRTGGAAGYVRVGNREAGGYPMPKGQGPLAITAGQLLSAGSVDGAVAYRQFEQSDNPYDVRFDKHRTGTVGVGPLQPIKASDAAGKPKPAAAASTGSPQGV